MTIGIYCITNKINGKMYIGQSINIEKRYKTHCRSLKYGSHDNKHLQRSYNKHGESAFELLLKNGLSHKEIASIYDISRTVITRISNGTRWTNVTGGPITAVVYEGGMRKFSEMHRKKIGEGRKGKLHTEESKMKISMAKRGK